MHISKSNIRLTALALVFPAALSAGENPVRTVAEPEGTLTLADAAALTLAGSPELKPYSWDARIQEGAAIQAASRPNPELTFEVENALGSGSYRAFDAAELTLSLSQTIEFGRRRIRRIEVATRDVRLAEQGYILKRAEVLNRATKAFLNVLAAQESLGFAEQNLQMQKDLAKAQDERVKAGKLSESESESALAALALAEIEAQNVRAELAAARSELGAFWGNPKPEFTEAKARLAPDAKTPSFESYQDSLQNNPVVGYQSELVEKHRAALALEQSKTSPDLTAGIGARHFDDSDDNAVVFQFSLPIPLFDKNRGNIGRAHAELSKAESEKDAAVKALEAALYQAHQRLSAAHRISATLAASVLPSAERSYGFAKEGYQLGKFSYLELKAAQSILLDARRQLLGAQILYHKAKADLETLSGKTH